MAPLFGTLRYICPVSWEIINAAARSNDLPFFLELTMFSVQVVIVVRRLCFRRFVVFWLVLRIALFQVADAPEEIAEYPYELPVSWARILHRNQYYLYLLVVHGYPLLAGLPRPLAAGSNLCLAPILCGPWHFWQRAAVMRGIGLSALQ